MNKIEKIRITHKDNATTIEGTRITYPCKTTHFIKECTYCRICNIEGDTHCSEQSNCLNISIAEEHRANSLSKKVDYKIITYKIMGIGIVKTGVQINNTKYWHFKKGDWIRNQIMQESGVLIEKVVDGISQSEFRYNSYYN